MTITDEMVERAAKAGYEQSANEGADDYHGRYARPWSQADEETRAIWRRIERAALEAALSGKEE
jgi:hypothetical protein